MGNIEVLVGKTLSSVVKEGDDLIRFTVDGEKPYAMMHLQNCCESVRIEDICGDLQDLVGSPILYAREDTNNENPLSEYEESFTWTFYNIATVRGVVTIRWYGSSNGYYSESVDFIQEGEYGYHYCH